MDLARLRDVLHRHIVGLKDAGTHETLPTICENLGLPVPATEGSKRDRMTAAFDALSDTDVPHVAERFLDLHPTVASTRNEIQDLLWADVAVPDIPKKFRREVARALGVEDLYLDAKRFDDLLDRLWVLDFGLFDIFGGADRSIRAEINQHVHRNPGDWPTEHLFDKLGAFDASNRRFALFLEGLSSSDVRPDEEAQRHFVQLVNEPLRRCGVEMREIDTEDGYPVFKIVSTYGTPTGRPKNLIFASSVKPDLRFRDAINNDIEIVTNADKVLVYDRPISIDGVRWRDLQCWWSELNDISNDDEADGWSHARKACKRRRFAANLNTLDSVATVRKLVAFYVEQHNRHLPHSAFHGQTPDEMYFGTGADIPKELATSWIAARQTRLAANRALSCKNCGEPVSLSS